MEHHSLNSFDAATWLSVGNDRYKIFSLRKLEEQGKVRIAELPFSIRILLENSLRREDGYHTTTQDIEKIIHWRQFSGESISFFPGRVLLQDFTGVPCMVDFAAMRDAVKRMGKDPQCINPVVPVDLVIDHSVQVDYYGDSHAFARNRILEFERNRERYRFLKWAQQNLHGFRVVPPGVGIVHQVNLEYLACIVQKQKLNDEWYAFPDSLIGTDSHTTMINGLGVFGFGVGGIEAESVMLGQPYFMSIPEVVGMRLMGRLPGGATATDLVLTITEILRKYGVVDKIVEYFGPGLEYLTIPDRATIANMSPECGCTMGFFPIDRQTLDYLEFTGRGELVNLVEGYCKEQNLFYNTREEPIFSTTLEVDLAKIRSTLAGPKRPNDRVFLSDIATSFRDILTTPVEKRGFGVSSQEANKKVDVEMDASKFQLAQGSVVIAAITSCTNTSNPMVMLAAGLVAKKALDKGLKVRPWVKTSLAPGSRVVMDYLESSGLLSYLQRAGFYLAGYGCTTCIGNSGPLKEPVARAIEEHNLVAVSVLSGNRNFEGRIHPMTQASYLMSPPMVVVYAFVGRIDWDMEREPVGHDDQGNPVYFRDIWPDSREIADLLHFVSPDMFCQQYAKVFTGEEEWESLEIGQTQLYPWDCASTYIKNPPFFENFELTVRAVPAIRNARVLLLLGDTVTTDHISPAGYIARGTPAGQYLMQQGITPIEFNSYGSRRGNHEVMMRGTFANTRIKNLLLPGSEGGITLKFPEKCKMSIYDAAMKYRAEGIATVVIAGKEYGTGSSRDWAAKGTSLLGIRAVIAESYERIHRNNLIGMGVLPLQFQRDQSWQSLKISGEETFDILFPENPRPGQKIDIIARHSDASELQFQTILRLDTQVDVDCYLRGGILQGVLRKIIL